MTYGTMTEDQRAEALDDAYADMVAEAGPCGGSGEVLMECQGKHRGPCGGPACTDQYVECLGCEDCA
jgi:hypothetical protein